MPAALLATIRGIGLSISETVILSVLLRGGPMLASKIAKESRLNRTTCYGILNELIEKGLVSKGKDKSATRFESLAPEMLPEYVAKRRAELATREQELRDAIPQMQLLRNKASIVPKVRFFEGKEGVELAYEDTLENNREKALRAFTGIDAGFARLSPVFLKHYQEKRAGLGIRADYLLPDTDAGKQAMANDEKYLRTAWVMPQSFNFESEVVVYDDKVGIFTFSKESPVALIIEDTAIAQTMRTLFDNMCLVSDMYEGKVRAQQMQKKS